MLERGGNAVDAAVATTVCQGVMNPMASGMGGGCLMLIRLPNGSATVIDAREVAPAGASEKMFEGTSRPQGLAAVGCGVCLWLGDAVGCPTKGVTGIVACRQQQRLSDWRPGHRRAAGAKRPVDGTPAARLCCLVVTGAASRSSGSERLPCSPLPRQLHN